MKSFHFNVSSPDEQFFDGDIEALTLRSPDGALAIYADHQPMVVAVEEGEVTLKQGDEWKSFITTGGFAEVTGTEVIFFTTAAEWEDENDLLRTTVEKADAIKALRHRKSVFDHIHTKIEITRALSRLGRNKSQNM